jgi:NAD(P)-dependent dehydrogenase (short-subunit alcohol dehydrogenase family)
MSSSQAVLITGCSSGIGRATALRLARAGRLVYATARDEHALTELAEAGCRTLVLDVADEDSRAAAVEAVVAEHGAVGALVNNAGYSMSGALESLPLDEVRRQFETNVFGLLRMCQLVLPGMRRQRAGRIVNISSMGANFTLPGFGAYHASKYAIEALSDALRFEVQGFGVQLVVIQPGLIRTDFARSANARMQPVAPPYDAFNAAVARASTDVYDKGPLVHLTGTADAVAKAVESAITSRRPRTRIRVTPSAAVMIAQRHLMSDRMWDRFLATRFPRPAP